MKAVLIIFLFVLVVFYVLNVLEANWIDHKYDLRRRAAERRERFKGRMWARNVDRAFFSPTTPSAWKRKTSLNENL